MKLLWTNAAVQSLRAIRQYINADHPVAARKVGRCIEEAVRQLEAFPQIGRPGMKSGTRELVVPGVPYVVVYRIADDTVQVLGVYHTRQHRH